jgi:phosphohistidine phosphatase
MKKLFLIRHAKSSWDDPAMADKDRPLNKRGKKDASFMGAILHKQGVSPNLLISSPAKRAYSTAKKIAKKIQYPVENIQTIDTLYHSTANTLLEVIHSQPADVQTLMLFAHNPGLNELVSLICDKQIENIPTCGIVCVSFQASQWQDIGKSNSHFEYFDFPKNHQQQGEKK